MNKIVIVSEYFYPNNSSTSQYLTEISHSLSKLYSEHIQIICSSNLGNHKELDFTKGKIIRLPESTLNKNKLFSKILQVIISTFKLGFSAFRSLKSGDKLLTVTNPAFLLVVFALFKKIKNFHYTLLVYDVFPENLIATGLTKPDSSLYKITKKIFDWAYAQTDLLVVIGLDMQNIITQKTKGRVPSVLIPNWCDTDSIVPSVKENNPIIVKFGLENKIVFAFTGNFGRVQGIENLLKAASLISDRDFVLLFIGDGAMRPQIEQYINDHPNGNVVYAGAFPSTDQNLFLNACDVAIMSLNENMYGLGVPSKSYYNMAAAKPLFFIGNEHSEIAEVIKEHDIGWTSSSDPIHIARMIETICMQKSEFLQLGEKARKVVETYFSKTIILEKYKNTYRELQ